MQHAGDQQRVGGGTHPDSGARGLATGMRNGQGDPGRGADRPQSDAGEESVPEDGWGRRRSKHTGTGCWIVRI